MWEGFTYYVSLSSNSTISTFKFNQPQMQISFNVTGPPGTTGYCNVTIPKSLLSDSPWTITIDNQPPINFILISNDTHSFLYFTYTHTSTLQVTITGTSVIPEFSTTMIIFSLILTTTLMILRLKKRKSSPFSIPTKS